MKRGTYVKGDELSDIVLLRNMAVRFGKLADRTPEKDWARKMRTMRAYCLSIIEERLLPMKSAAMELGEGNKIIVDENGRPIIKDKGAFEAYAKIIKRAENLTVSVISRDTIRVRAGMLECKQRNEKVTILFEDLVYLWMVVEQYVCRKCKCNKVKQCEIRQILHATDCEPYTNTPKENECEYHWDSNCREIDIDINESEEQK